MAKNKESIRQKESALANISPAEAEICLNEKISEYQIFASNYKKINCCENTTTNLDRGCYRVNLELYKKYKLPEMKVILEHLKSKFHYLRNLR